MSIVAHKTPLFFFICVLSIHVFLISLLPKRWLPHYQLTQTIEPKLLVTLLPSKKVSNLTDKAIVLSKPKLHAEQRFASVPPALSENTSFSHTENSTEQQAIQEKSTHSIHNTRHWAKQFSNLPDSSLKESLRKKEFIAAPQTELQNLQKNMIQSVRPDCKTAHSKMGLLAIPMLLHDLTNENGCKW